LATAAALAAAALAGCGGIAPAPSLSALPLARGAQVIASAAGGSQVNPGRDHNRYRYVAVGGPLTMRRTQLITSQVQSMISHGWGQERSLGFRGTSTVAEPVPVTAVGAEVLLNAPGRNEYAAMSLLPDPTVAAVQTARSPLWQNAAIGRALADRQPVLWIVLGNGTHS
jgi:hypothetical protein